MSKKKSRGGNRPKSGQSGRGSKPAAKPDWGGEGQSAASTGRPAAKPGGKQGQRKLTGSARRAAQRKAAKRKRQMVTFGIPAAVIVIIVIVAFALGGAPTGGGKVAGSVKVDGPALDKPLAEGDPVPSFSAPGLNGGTVSWAKGKPTVLTIWAAWCPHCQVELPKLNEIKSTYPGVDVTSINTAQGQEPGPTPEQFVKDNKITIPVAIDDAGKTLSKAMGVVGFPTLYFINADGTVYKQYEGEVPDADLNAAFQHLQSQSAPSSPSPKG